MKGEWRGRLFSGAQKVLPSCLLSTLSEATVAMTPWSYIQRVKFEELGGGSANLSHAGFDYTERKREGYFQHHKETKQLSDFFSFHSITVCDAEMLIT